MKIAIFETLPGFGGGNIYQKYVADGLKLSHEVRVFRVKGHQLLGTRLGKAWHAARYFRCYPQIDLWISTFLPTIALNFCRPKGKVISLFYHLDDVDYPNTLISYLLRYLYLRQAKRSNGVVVISRYWQSFMERLKVNITDLIYWGFDISKFKLNTNQVEYFRKKYNLPDKPIIYLGNCHEKKGVVEAFQVLRHLDAYLVTSGKANVKIPVRNFDLSYSEYLLLLHVSDVVLTLSKFNEGWNATAHEAMLLGTPVIGSGKGGMAELLEGGGQLICRDLSALPELVEYALAHTAALSENGYGFASQFTIERFNLAWQNLVARFE